MVERGSRALFSLGPPFVIFAREQCHEVAMYDVTWHSLMLGCYISFGYCNTTEALQAAVWTALLSHVRLQENNYQNGNLPMKMLLRLLNKYIISIWNMLLFCVSGVAWKYLTSTSFWAVKSKNTPLEVASTSMKLPAWWPCLITFSSTSKTVVDTVLVN